MPAAPVEDEDTKVAVVAHCMALPELSAAIPGGFHDGIVKGNPRPAMPYARIMCVQGPTANRYPAPIRGQGHPDGASGYSDYRKVTLTLTGIKAAVVTACGILKGHLSWQPRLTKDAAGNTRAAMTVPHATLILVTPLGEPRFEEDKTRVDGDRIWNGIVDYEVWTGRNVT